MLNFLTVASDCDTYYDTMTGTMTLATTGVIAGKPSYQGL